MAWALSIAFAPRNHMHFSFALMFLPSFLCFELFPEAG